MSINDISLTSGMRSNLISLQGAVDLLGRTQERLATGKKVNSALDNPITYFASRAQMSRANDLSSLKENMGEAIQTIKAADAGITAISELIDSAKALAKSAIDAAQNQIKIQFTSITGGSNAITVGGISYQASATASAITSPTTTFLVSDDISTTVANLAALINANEETSADSDMTATASGTTLILQAKAKTVAITAASSVVSTTAMANGVGEILEDTDGYDVFSDRRILAQQYNDIMAQINATANSSGYKGINLLMENDLNVVFEGSALNVKGFSAVSSDLQLSTRATTTGGLNELWGWSLNSDINKDIGKMDIALSTLRAESSRMSSNLGIVNIQEEFATNMINTLTEGANNLTLADMNEEGANMLMLQTRQALSSTALSLSAQASQSVLRLF